MARLLIKIEKEDVTTSKLGENIMIQCKNDIDLIFTPEAMEELINDYNDIDELFRWQSLKEGDVIYDEQIRYLDVDYHKAIIKKINIDERYVIAYDVSNGVDPNDEIKLTNFLTEEEFNNK